jgi:site-specific DNA recombinase
MEYNKLMKVALYVRVSTDIQVDGYSIDEQLERLRKFCEAHGWTIYKEYVDPGFTGSNIDRPAMLKMLKDIREKKFDTVLVYKLDRLSRSQKDTLYLIEEEFLPNGVDFISMSENFDTSTPFGKAMIGILSVFAQLEREQIKERMAMGHIGRAKSGYWRGGSNPPIGYDFIDGKLEVNNYEALQIRKIFSLFLSGESMHGIAKFMNENYTNKYSNYKHHCLISTILRNELYIGKIKYKGVTYDGVHEPIIDEDTFNIAQLRYAEISASDDHHYRSPFKGKHLLTGLIFCGTCNARYFTWTSRSSKKDESGKQKKLGEKYAYYKCYSRDKNSKMKTVDFCDNPTYKVELLDNIVMEEIKKLKLDPGYLESLIQTPAENPGIEEIKTLSDKLKECTSKIDKLMDLYTLGSIPIADIGDRVQKLYEEKDKLEEQIELIKENSKEPDVLSFTETRKILDAFEDNLDELPLSRKRELVQSLIKRIEIEHDRFSFKIYWKFN